jgi:hypothetical protein
MDSRGDSEREESEGTDSRGDSEREESEGMDSWSDSEHGEEMEQIPSWRDDVLDHCRRWLDEIQEEPLVGDDQEQPDLYSFYEELAVLRNEFRKSSRRSHETFVQFGSHLDKFDGVMGSLSQRLESFARDKENSEFAVMQETLMHIVEIHERLRRFNSKLKSIGSAVSSEPMPVSTGFWSRLFCGENRSVAPASPDVSDSVVEGFTLIMSHFDEFLIRTGVSRTVAVGAPFDPARMMAVGAVTSDAHLPNTVVEEIAGGYAYRGRVLKLAKVTVSRPLE